MALSLKNNLTTWIPKVHVVGDKIFDSRIFLKCIKTLDKRMFRGLVSPPLLLAAEVGLVNRMSHLMQAPSISHAGAALFSIYEVGMFAVYLKNTGKNVRLVDFSILKRRKRQSILKAIEYDDLEKIKSIKIKDWNWKAFRNLSLSSLNDKPVTPLDYAVENESWDIVLWLLKKGATPIFPLKPDPTTHTNTNFEKIDALSEKEKEKYRQSQKTWEGLIFDAPTEVVIEALRIKIKNEREDKSLNEDIIFTSLLTNLFQQITFKSESTTAIEIFNKAPDLFNAKNLKKMIPLMMTEEDDPLVMDLFRVMMSHVEKEDFKTNLETASLLSVKSIQKRL